MYWWQNWLQIWRERRSSRPKRYKINRRVINHSRWRRQWWYWEHSGRQQRVSLIRLPSILSYFEIWFYRCGHINQFNSYNLWLFNISLCTLILKHYNFCKWKHWTTRQSYCCAKTTSHSNRSNVNSTDECEISVNSERRSTRITTFSSRA